MPRDQCPCLGEDQASRDVSTSNPDPLEGVDAKARPCLGLPRSFQLHSEVPLPDSEGEHAFATERSLEALG